ncbi:MAG: photosynthetic reaction center subunit H [Pseudomonadota bacterium]
MTEPIFANLDLASISLWLFVLFFALLVYYIQRENMREGYPLQDDDGNEASNQGPFPVPSDKTFKLPHGRGEVTVPSGQHGDRTDLALKKTAVGNGFPFEPTGDPMVDGVGPASWAPRRDVPELDGEGHPKIVPMANDDSYSVVAGRDPRGLPVEAGDGSIVGKISGLWLDRPEQLVRYLEMELDEKWGSGKRMIPITMLRIKRDRVEVVSIFGKHFAGVPQIASPRQITLLEEEKVCAYYAGGCLYASERRTEPLIG